MKYLFIPLLVSFSLLTAQQNIPTPNLQEPALNTYGSYQGGEQYLSEGAQQVVVEFEENIGTPKNIEHPNATDFVIPESGLYLVGYKIQLQNFDDTAMYVTVSVEHKDNLTPLLALATSYDIPKIKTRDAIAQGLVHFEANSTLQLKVFTPVPTGDNGLGVFEPNFYLIKIGG